MGLLQALYRGQNLDAFAVPGIEGLHVLPAGAILADPTGNAEGTAAEWRADPAQVLGTKRMRELLSRAREEYDVIIVDTPPVLVASEGIGLATQVDAAILVARAGTTKEGDFSAAMGLLEDVGAPVVGAVLNAFDLSMAYGYRYSYSHYSKYGPYSAYNYGTDKPAKRKGLLQ
jgi:receptor protein-tyrosine kinase